MIARSIENNTFLSSVIYQELQKQVPLLHKETREINQHTITVFDNKTGAINQAVRIFREVSLLAKRQPEDRISCFLYLLDFPKQINLNKPNITSAECNTASTTFYSLENKIEVALWRKEEWQKVFYHELIHAFSIDTILSPMKEPEQQIKQRFPHYNNSIQEAYTEILATRLASKENLKDEALFIGSQVNKIIYFMEHNEPIIETAHNLGDRSGIEHIDTFFKNPSRLLDSNTNTSSYYVLKSIYYWYAVTYDRTLLDISKLTDKSFIRQNFYRILLEALESGEYQKWLKGIYFKPTSLSLRLTYGCL